MSPWHVFHTFCDTGIVGSPQILEVKEAQLHTTSVTLGKSFNLFKSQFPFSYNGNNKTFFVILSRGFELVKGTNTHKAPSIIFGTQ